MTRDEVRAYYEGQREATRRWAWWKDGVQHVGCGVFTLERALDMIQKEEAIDGKNAIG